jgi:outer membrane protein TolC
MATAFWPVLAGLTLAAACQSENPNVLQSVGAYRDRMLAADEQEVAAGSNDAAAAFPPGMVSATPPTVRPVSSQAEQPPRQSLLTTPATTTQPAPQEVLGEIPDPLYAADIFQQRVQDLVARKQEERVVSSYQRVVAKAHEYLQQIRQPKQVQLSLAECIQRALVNSYVIRIEAYNPAIAQTQLVEAEAAFDTVFFLDTSWDNRDEAATFRFFANQSDARSINGGLRKILPTGMQASVGLRQSRSYTDSEYVTPNPAYDTRFVATIAQPLLRGFGLDYNRALINVARADQRIAQKRFIQQVRDTLLNVETAYWQLAQARRQVMILAESVAQNYVTYETMKLRGIYDATPVGLYNAESRWKSREVQYQEAIKAVHDAEDQLKNLLNDPELKLSDSVEIIPTETLLVAPVALDHFAEVRAALDQRTEIEQARLEIEKARISTMRAKNETLPQLDLSFQYEVQGLKGTADTSWDRMATHRFRSYTLGASFSYPLGNRRARAIWVRARSQEHQALVALNRMTDAIVQEVNAAVRALSVGCANIAPQWEAARAAERNLRALQARSQRIDPTYLETELSTIEQLANARNTLLQVVTNYNLALVQLEKAKGTLLEYNNVAVTDEPRRP